jgi:hypothetical protein
MTLRDNLGAPSGRNVQADRKNIMVTQLFSKKKKKGHLAHNILS